MTTELYKKHRPKTLKDLVGQVAAVKMLRQMNKTGKVPHSILLIGPSGTGKTTTARIIAKMVGCVGRDFIEINAADMRGIDLVREIRSRVSLLASKAGGKRVWLIDEIHQMTKPAQEAMLKMLEDTPPHVHFILATTDPQDLKKTLRNRCTEITLKSLTPKDMTLLLTSVLEKEEVECSEDVLDAILNEAQGCPRAALVMLNSVLHLEDDDERIAMIKQPNVEAQAIEIARALCNGKGWKEISAIIKKVDEDPEKLRWMILSYASNVLLGGKPGPQLKRAVCMLSAFRDNFYDSKRAGLVLACYEVVHP